jgi:retron-type reverse transcriptase
MKAKPIHFDAKVRGVAQGGPLSPLLSLLALEKTLIKNKEDEIIMYADDGVIYSNKLSIEEMKERLKNIGMGIEVN